VSEPLTIEQQFLFWETPISELDKVVEVIAGKPEDPGFLQPASKRVAMVIGELERTIAKQRATLEAIGRAEGVL
jgi:hypothetical protein